MSVPSDLIRAMYNVPAFRGSRTGATRGKWWSSSPEEASAYSYHDPHIPHEQAKVVIPGQLNTEGFLSLDAGGKYYDQIDSNTLPPNIANQIRRSYGRLPQAVSTDMIANAIEALQLPGVTIRNVLDQAESPAHQYFVNDPTRRRSRFAKFEDPNSPDIMAGLLLSLMGGGAAAAANQQGQET